MKLNFASIDIKSSMAVEIHLALGPSTSEKDVVVLGRLSGRSSERPSNAAAPRPVFVEQAGHWYEAMRRRAHNTSASFGQSESEDKKGLAYLFCIIA